jgi:hypothetical protein
MYLVYDCVRGRLKHSAGYVMQLQRPVNIEWHALLCISHCCRCIFDSTVSEQAQAPPHLHCVCWPYVECAAGHLEQLYCVESRRPALHLILSTHTDNTQAASVTH